MLLVGKGICKEHVEWDNPYGGAAAASIYVHIRYALTPMEWGTFVNRGDVCIGSSMAESQAFSYRRRGARIRYANFRHWPPPGRCFRL